MEIFEKGKGSQTRVGSEWAQTSQSSKDTTWEAGTRGVKDLAYWEILPHFYSISTPDQLCDLRYILDLSRAQFSHLSNVDTESSHLTGQFWGTSKWKHT